MKAFQIEGFGFQGLLPVDRPQPGHLKPREVLVQLKAASLNYRDLMVVRGEYNPRQSLPLVPLSDAAGEVVSVGTEVTTLQPGDRVAGIFMQGWQSGQICREYSKTTLGSPLEGVLSEYRVFSESGLVPVPEHLSFEEASTLPCAALTAWRSLFVDYQLKPGQTVLLQGTGGVSLFALQFARAAGANVVLISSSDEKLERARALGADHCINYRRNPEWSQGLQVDVVLELGGASTIVQSVKALKMGGQINLIGRLGGGATEIDLVQLFMNRIRFQGIFVGNREDFVAMNQAVALHQLHPVIDRVFAFEESVAAFRYLESAGHMGKVVIKL